jgi:hypothetical protein
VAVHDIDSSIAVELKPLNHRYQVALTSRTRTNGDHHEAFGSY